MKKRTMLRIGRIFKDGSYGKRHFHGRSVCVVGAGPAGFYSAQQVLKGNPGTKVDILEKLPVPFGLVRFGVAPDHPEVKNVESTFTKTMEKARFLGNVDVGKDVRVSELLSLYDAVILSSGASRDRLLGIKGEEMDNVVSARKFVGFYNGLPEEKDFKIDLGHDSAVIIGLGNVALDVARILLTPVDDLRKTDITEAALDVLSESRIKNVHIVGRRGPLQVAFTIKEFREMANLRGCRPILDQKDFVGVREIVPDLKRPRKRLAELMAKTALDPPTEKQQELWGDASKKWHLKLLKTPLEILNDGDGSVTGIKLGINRLVSDNLLSEAVEDTGKIEVIDCGLVLRSVGYKSVPLEDGIPFDKARGIVPNIDGRVLGRDRLYCTGWLATGPRGVIVDTMNDAFRVGQCVIDDLKEMQESDRQGSEGLDKLLGERNVETIGKSGWEAIDSAETKKGMELGKPREKITSVKELLSVAKKS